MAAIVRPDGFSIFQCCHCFEWLLTSCKRSSDAWCGLCSVYVLRFLEYNKTTCNYIKTHGGRYWTKQDHKTQNRNTKLETESQNPIQKHKTQNRITKPKTETQNSKQNHKTQNRNTKLQTESQNPKQKHKTQNRITKLKTETQNQKRKYKIDNRKKIKKTVIKNSGLARLLRLV